MKYLLIIICSFLLFVLSAASTFAEKKSVEEIARELANPNTPLASITFKLQHRIYEGDLPDSDDQSGTTLLFQPTLPFPLANGDKILFRPAAPFQFDQPVFNAGNLDFDDESGMGDISFDLAYAITTDKGLLTAFGIISSLPTATEDTLGTDRFTLGPEFLIGKLSKKYVLGAFPNHQWDFAGPGDADINLTTTQIFAVYLPEGGWNLGSSPIMTFDHIEDEWTIPLNLSVGKTIMRNGRPWKLGIEINYYIKNPDLFGPKWMVSFNVAPVVKNVLAGWFD